MKMKSSAPFQNALYKNGGIAITLAISFLLSVSLVGCGTKGTASSAASAESKEEGAKSAAGSASEPESGLITLTPDAQKTAGIQTGTVRRTPLAEMLSVPGTVEVSPGRGASITPPVSGRIIDLPASPGDDLKIGQIVARLDSPEVAEAHAAVRAADTRIAEAKAAVQTAEAGVEQTRTKAASAESALSRQRELAQSGQVSQPSFQAAQNELSDAQAAQKEAVAGLEFASSVTARTKRLFDAEIAPRAELEQAQTAERQASAKSDRASQRVEVASAALARERRVFGSGLLNRQVVQGAEAELRAAQGDVRQALKQVQSARTVLSGAITSRSVAEANLRAIEGDGHSEGGAGRIALYSPITGTVAERRVNVGQAVERSSELLTIQNLSTVMVVAQVPEASAGRVRVGASVTVTVTAYPKATFTGIVQSVGSSVNEKTRALPVRCLVRNPNSVLKPEMFARVSLTTGAKRTALAVPESAVDEDGADRFVYVAKEGGYEKRAVTAGNTVKGMTEIMSGLKEDEKIAINGLFVLKSESRKDELKEEE